MADYNCFTRTCYFHVLNEDEFRSLMEKVVISDEGNAGSLSIFTKPDDAGNLTFAFGVYGSIDGIRPDGTDDECEASYDLFVKGLQGCLVAGDVIIIAKVGHEKMNYFSATGVIVSKTKCKFYDFHDMLVNFVGDIEPDWPEGTSLDY